MTTKPILIVAGEPYSVFIEIYLKSLKKKKIKNLKNPIILICSKSLLVKQMKKFHRRNGWSECYPITALDFLRAELISVKL